MQILIVEDDIDTLNLLTVFVQKFDNTVLTARNGVEAWKIIQKEPVSMVISDWMMPEMDGLQLCKKIRSTDLKRYIYFILLTTKNSTNELIAGMEAGADDFIVKPFNRGELKVRIRAGERIIELERNLEERNKRLREAYHTINKDLKAAAAMQKSLLPTVETEIGDIHFEWLLLPCAGIAGDILNFFRLDENNIGFYLLDVSGHGIQAAMLSVTLSKLISPSPIQGSPLKHFTSIPPYYGITPPALAISDLNNRFQIDHDYMQYFTIIYGTIHLKNGIIRLCQAGHPSPIFLKKKGKISLIGSGGFPVGLLMDMKYTQVEFDFQPGDRLFLYSDGVTECTNQAKMQFSQQQLIRLIKKYRSQALNEVLENIKNQLCKWKGNNDFQDDVSILAIERKKSKNT
ncbi:MAG: SpoIIE family protein phosphatase [bacterium]